MNLKELKNKSYQEIADMARTNHIADMAIIGKFKCDDTFKVEVWPRDNGYVPHIHITVYEGKDDKVKFQSAVKLTRPEYFPHGGKYEDIFSSRQKKAFIKFISSVRQSTSKKLVDMTNYEYCCMLWNDNDSRRKVNVQYDENDNPIIPDYSQL